MLKIPQIVEFPDFRLLENIPHFLSAGFTSLVEVYLSVSSVFLPNFYSLAQIS
jgi:hypothetical protein